MYDASATMFYQLQVVRVVFPNEAQQEVGKCQNVVL